MARKSLKKSTSTRSMSALRMPGFNGDASLYASGSVKPTRGRCLMRGADGDNISALVRPL